MSKTSTSIDVSHASVVPVRGAHFMRVAFFSLAAQVAAITIPPLRLPTFPARCNRAGGTDITA